MKTITTHYAKTHLSRLLKEVQQGETLVILNGRMPVGQLSPIPERQNVRPKVGSVISNGVTWDDDAFAPLTPIEQQSWGV